MHTFKVGDYVRQRPDVDRYYVTNSATSTVLKVVKVVGAFIRVEVVEHAVLRMVGNRFAVEAALMCPVVRIIVVSEGDYNNHEALSNEDKSIIRSYVESQAV